MKHTKGSVNLDSSILERVGKTFKCGEPVHTDYLLIFVVNIVSAQTQQLSDAYKCIIVSLRTTA